MAATARLRLALRQRKHGRRNSQSAKAQTVFQVTFLRIGLKSQGSGVSVRRVPLAYAASHLCQRKDALGMLVVPRACRDPHAVGQTAEQGAENGPRGCVYLESFGEFLITKRTTVAWEACHCGCPVLFICDEGGSDAEDAVPAQGTLF